MTKKEKYIIRYVVLTFCICLFFVIGLFFIGNKLIDKENVLSYSESSDIDYKVTLKENNFFDESILSRDDLKRDNRTLITQLIDNIIVDFHYTIDYSGFINGNYSYYIKAVVEANKTNNESGNYWSRDFALSEKKSFNIENVSGFSINDSVTVNYDEYNSIYNDFKKGVDVSSDGKLKLVLVVDSVINGKPLVKEYSIKSNIGLDLPLTKSATEININTNDGSKKDSIKEKIEMKDNNDTFDAIVVIVCLCAILLCIYFMYKNYVNHKKNNYYCVTLNNILGAYDSIIVNVSSAPKEEGYNIIKVKSFEELLDAHNEVRLPINYYQSKKRAIFTLIHDNVMYVYILNRN